MKTQRIHALSLLAALLLGGALTHRAAADFVYETSGEFLTAGDFNGDGVADVLILDKLTGNARVGYANTNGGLFWSAPLLTSVDNITGCAVGHFRVNTRDILAVTATNLNRVPLFDLLNTNFSTLLVNSSSSGVGPHTLASLAAPFGSPPPPYGALLVASSLNDAPAERLDIVTNFPTGFSSSAGQFPEIGSFQRPNAVPLGSNGPALAAGLLRGTNDTLHLWQFTNAPSMFLALSNLPPGSEYVVGNFNGETLPHFILYVPGKFSMSIYSLIATNTGLVFSAPIFATAAEPLQQVYFLATDSGGTAVMRFGDGIQSMRLPGGIPAFSGIYRAGVGTAGNVFTGIVPLANGRFALLDAPAGSGYSVHEQVIRFDGASFSQVGAANLPALTTSTTRANLWLFQREPFVNRDPGFIASINASDWSDSFSGLPGALNVVREQDAGTNNGLGSAASSNYGAPPTGATNGLPNQYQPAISIFSYSAPRAAEPVSILIAPPPGTYPGPVQISLSWPGTGRQAFYRVGPAGSWQSYSAPFLITNDATIQYYGTTLLSPTRSQVQFATYTLGVPGTSPPPSIDPNPDDTNTPPVLSTNAIVFSETGTLFYGRVSPNLYYTIWAINLDGSADTYVTTGARPRVSRDGRYLAFLRDANPQITQGNVWIRDLASGKESILFTNTSYTTGFDWDLTNTNLVFDWNCWLWKMSLGGSATLLPLPSPDCYDDAPVVSPVDGRLAFHNLDPNAKISGLYVTTPDLNSKQLLSLGVAGASWPAWSPDAQRLSFADGNSPQSAFTSDNGTNLWVVSPDGTSLNQITGFSDGINRFPHGAIWSPDGDALVGAATVFGTNGLWVIPLTPDRTDCDGPPYRLPTSPGDPIDFAGSIVVATPASQVVLTQAVGLFIRQTPDAVVVYWNTNLVGYTLESEPDLPSGFWQPVNGPYFQAGPYFEHWETRASLLTTKFFRLHYTGAFVLSQPPVLTVRRQAANALLSWPASLPGFVLQYKTNLSPATAWRDLPAPYTLNGANYNYLDPANSSPQRYYRLRSP